LRGRSRTTQILNIYEAVQPLLLLAASVAIIHVHYFALRRVRSAIFKTVCLWVYLLAHVSKKTTYPNFTKFAVAKYCDEYVCLCVRVCLFAMIPPEPHTRSLSNVCVLLLCCICPWLGRPPACWRQAASPVGRKGVTVVHSAGEA